MRHFYTGSVIVDVCAALALLVETNPLGRIMGNVYLRVANPGVPTQVFDSERKALTWLRPPRGPWPPCRDDGARAPHRHRWTACRPPAGADRAHGGGDLALRAPISRRRDTIDALAFGLNLLGGELGYTLEGLRRSQAEAERSNAAKEVFLRNVTHELRTPITAVILVAEALRRPELAVQRRLVLCERLERNAQTLLRMIDHLLDLTRTETGRLELAYEALAPATIAREVVELLDLEADQKKVGLRLVVGRDAHPVVFSDAIRLRQILLNVVGNAIKYTEAGRVVVRLGRTANPAAATIEVRDTGVGVARRIAPSCSSRSRAAAPPPICSRGTALAWRCHAAWPAPWAAT